MRSDTFVLHADYERRHWWFVARRRIVQALVHQILPPSKERLIVDVGCGTGANVDAFAREYDCIGIDTSAEGTALARQNYPHCRFITGFAPEDLGEAAGRADMFLLMDVLEHVRDDIGLFTNLMAAAKPGAHVLITVPADPRLWSSHDIVHMHYRRYTTERLMKLWQDQPLIPLVVTHFNSRLYRLIRATRSVSRILARSWGHGGTDLKLPPAPVNRLLTSIFEGETNRISRDLRSHDRSGGGHGISMLAIVRREGGVVERRQRTPELAATDLHDPERTP
jgi:SAM-dependent methyltransferase